MHKLLERIIDNKEMHARWLNTLSMMENNGAKKIKKCEHPVFVSETILKHAAEEARHAYFLKRQINKINPDTCPTYEKKYLLAPKSSYAYLNRLDIEVCRYLKNKFGLRAEKLKYAAYLLVTYAIEVRADALYPVYQEVLQRKGSPVSVRTIIIEEENHLKEMKKQLASLSAHAGEMCQTATELESSLFQDWITELAAENSIISLS